MTWSRKDSLDREIKIFSEIVVCPWYATTVAIGTKNNLSTVK